MKKIISAFCAFALILSLGACSNNTEKEEQTTTEAVADATTTANEEATTEAPSEPVVEINIAVLSGPTGVGASKLMNDNAEGKNQNKYNFTVETENTNVTSGLMSGDYDIAMVATNVAANLYNKSQSIQIAAINTLGVLSIINCTDEEIATVEDLKGKTIYSPGKGANPEYVINHILKSNGLTVGTDVFVEFAAADEIIAKMVSEGGICMLPQPAATTLLTKAENAKEAIVISDEWDKLDNGSRLSMGCVVVRKEFAQAHPEAVEKFLTEYAASIEFVNENPAEASAMIVEQGIIGNAKIAEKAIPKCNLVCITGEEIKPAIENYYQVLFDANPDSIGGAVPADEFYYVG